MTEKQRAKFQVGDLVQSKAGGPKMVVDDIDLPDAYDISLDLGHLGGPMKETGFDPADPARKARIRYDCVWWVGQKQHRETFSEGSLVAWTEPTA